LIFYLNNAVLIKPILAPKSKSAALADPSLNQQFGTISHLAPNLPRLTIIIRKWNDLITLIQLANLIEFLDIELCLKPDTYVSKSSWVT